MRRRDKEAEVVSVQISHRHTKGDTGVCDSVCVRESVIVCVWRSGAEVDGDSEGLRMSC